MYEEHTAREDTIVFPAWKKTLSREEFAQMSELFEDIEEKTLGKDGFERALVDIAGIESATGLDPARLTPPAPLALR